MFLSVTFLYRTLSKLTLHFCTLLHLQNLTFPASTTPHLNLSLIAFNYFGLPHLIFVYITLHYITYLK